MASKIFFKLNTRNFRPTFESVSIVSDALKKFYTIVDEITIDLKYTLMYIYYFAKCARNWKGFDWMKFDRRKIYHYMYVYQIAGKVIAIDEISLQYTPKFFLILAFFMFHLKVKILCSEQYYTLLNQPSKLYIKTLSAVFANFAIMCWILLYKLHLDLTPYKKLQSCSIYIHLYLYTCTVNSSIALLRTW